VAGTVFLDEVGEMPMPLQAKLLRVLETRTFRRVGSTAELPLRARIVSATNRGTGGADSALRADFLYRLGGFTIHLPPLRARGGDLVTLAVHFLRMFAERHEEPPHRLTPEALAELSRHTWPGNVRELRRFIEHLAITVRSEDITREDVAALIAQTQKLARSPERPPSRTSMLPAPNAVTALTPASRASPSLAPQVREAGAPGRPSAAPTPAGSRPSMPPSLAAPNTPNLRDLEREVITRAFKRCRGNVSKTAEELGLPRSTVRRRLLRYGLS
jgi:DNA-binding NtrC family response regulator